MTSYYMVHYIMNSVVILVENLVVTTYDYEIYINIASRVYVTVGHYTVAQHVP